VEIFMEIQRRDCWMVSGEGSGRPGRGPQILWDIIVGELR
jgi:hypothetical protein